MTKLHLYTIFHANLFFSSLPSHEYARVIDKCYWPLLELSKKGFRMGFEFPAHTLDMIHAVDATFIEALKDAWDKEQCDVIASAYTQNVFPLIPAKVNRKNLQIAKALYEDYLARVPDTAFVNEMTFSQSLPSLYQEFGFQKIIMDWDNASEFSEYPSECRYHPVWVEDEHSRLQLIWNSSMNSYKFQRYIYGRLTIEQYMASVMSHYCHERQRSLVLYGTDMEIFDYRPLRPEVIAGEIDKIEDLFYKLREHEEIDFIFPSQLDHVVPVGETLRIGTAECPHPCKNRDDYNVVRWALSGRDDVQTNTQCFRLYHLLSALEHMMGKSELCYWKELNYVWASDFRTKTTNEKHYDGKKRLWALSVAVDRATDQHHRSMVFLEDFELINPHDFDWDGYPFEVRMEFSPGDVHVPFLIEIDQEAVPFQYEDSEMYRDGSLRSFTLVLTPFVKAGQCAKGVIVRGKSSTKKNYVDIVLKGKDRYVETESMTLRLSEATGGDIRSVIFKGIHPSSLFGYVPPVYFDHIGHSSDYYSGGVHICDQQGTLLDDTRKAEIHFFKNASRFPIRIPILIELPLGADHYCWKKYYVYLSWPRIDLHYHFYLKDLRPNYFRLGTATLHQESFHRNSMYFSSVNGTDDIESFPLLGRYVNHTEPVGARSSARTCVGATEGWIAVGDRHKGVAISSDKSCLFTSPMIQYEEIRDKFLMRVFHSISETDETGHVLWRGHDRVRFSYTGFKGPVTEPFRNFLKSSNYKLICVQKKSHHVT